MKSRLFLLVLLAMTCFGTACSDDNDTGGATLSFGRAYYVLQAQAPLTVDLRANGPVESTLAVKFNVGGTAIEGEDYSISAKEFVFEPGKEIASVTVTPLNNYTSEREIKLELVPVPGYSLWNNKVTMIPIEAKEYLVCSFKKNWVELEALYQPIVEVKGAISGKFKSDIPLHLQFEIVEGDGTTAVEGVHYEIKDNVREFVIPAGQSEAQITLNFLKQEKGKDQITLRLKLPTDTYQYGNYAEMILKISGPLSFDKLEGTWQYKTFSSEASIRDLIGSDPDFQADLDLLPSPASSSGSIEFIQSTQDGKGKMISHLTGTLANYLMNCEIEFLSPEKFEDLWDTSEKDIWISMAHFNPVNGYFSSSSSDIRVGKVGMRLLDGGQTLEVRIEDCEPQDFLQLTFMLFGDMSLTPLVFHFTRVE